MLRMNRSLHRLIIVFPGYLQAKLSIVCLLRPWPWQTLESRESTPRIQENNGLISLQSAGDMVWLTFAKVEAQAMICTSMTTKTLNMCYTPLVVVVKGEISQFDEKAILSPCPNFACFCPSRKLGLLSTLSLPCFQTPRSLKVDLDGEQRKDEKKEDATIDRKPFIWLSTIVTMRIARLFRIARLLKIPNTMMICPLFFCKRKNQCATRVRDLA